MGQVRALPTRRLGIVAGAVAAAVVVIALLSSCSSDGVVQGQVMAIEAPGAMPRILQGATVVANCAGSESSGVTGSDGHYRIEKLKPGNCGLAITGPAGQRLQPEAAQFRLDGGQVQTINRVLLAEGMQRPPAPPPDQYRDVNRSMTSDPFFWYWVWSRPWDYPWVYNGRPYVYAGYGSSPGTVIIDNRTYNPPSGYKEVNPVTTPAARPQPVDVKGVARPQDIASQAAKPSNFSSGPGGPSSAAGGTAPGSGAGAAGGSSSLGAKPPGPSSSGGGAVTSSRPAPPPPPPPAGAKPPPPKK